MTLEKGTLGNEEDKEKTNPLDTSKFSEQPSPQPSLIEEFNKKMLEMTESFNKKINDLEKQKAAEFNPNDAKMIAIAVAEAMKIVNPKEIDSEIGMAEEEIPKDDWDAKGVRFCCPLVGYIISDDIRKGQRVVLPYKKKEVFFDYVSTRRIKTGRYDQIHPYSAYTSHSHRLTKWLRDHSLYMSMFYETSTDAVNVDARKATRMAEVMRQIRNYELHDLLKRCKENNVNPSEDVITMRQNLAYTIVMREIEGETASQQKSMEETFKTEKIFKG